MERLGRYPLSVILSYLKETEGCSLLLCRRSWALQLLPIFQLPDHGLVVIPAGSNGPRRKNRHSFIVVPVQDATVRLDRLNTRRWKQQRLQTRRHPSSTQDNRTINQPTTTTQRARHDFGHSLAVPPLLQYWPAQPKLSPFQKGVTVLVSYPRSGNTLIRSYLESITGVVTGSDTRPDRALSLDLADRYDLVGEGLCRPPITKTHWPERMGCQPFAAHRAILVVRNPWDAMDSCWNLNLTNTHTQKVTDAVYEEHANFFEAYIRNEMKVWCDFLQFWSQREIDILWVRYEDLMQQPQPELERIVQFYTLQTDTIDPDYWKNRIAKVLQKGHHGYQSSGSTSRNPCRFGQSLRRYSPGLVQELHALDQHGWLERLGYHQSQGFPNNENWPSLPSTTSQEGETSIRINQPGLDLRPPNCPYGRNMRAWRRRYTKDDKQPFPTI